MESSPDSPTNASHRTRAPWLGVALLSIVGAVLACAIGLRVFHQAPMTTDEHSYLFQAEVFLEGRVSRDAPPFHRAFQQEMVIIDEDAGWLSRYPPAHSIWLIPGVLLGDPHLMSAVSAALTIFVIAMTCRRIGVSPYIGAVLALCCPYLLFTNGTLLSHTSGMLAASLMIYCYLDWRQSGRLLLALCAGAAWGWLYLNRTYTAFCICLPFAVDALILLARERNIHRFLGVAAFAGTAVVGAGMLLVYNAVAVGDPFTMTYLFYDRSDALGFGPRHIHGNPPWHHTFARGMWYYVDNVGDLDEWMLGFRGSLLLAVVLAVYGRSSRTPLLLAAPFAVWIGYILFWFPGVNGAGPTYYAESVPFILVAAAPGVSRLLGSPRLRHGGRRRGLAVAGTAALALLSGTFVVRSGQEVEDYYFELSRILQTIRSAPEGSMVFIDPGIHTKFQVHNPHGLNSDPLVVRPSSRHNESIARFFSERTTYLLHVEVGESCLERVDLMSTFRFGMRGASAHRHTGMNYKHRGVAQRVALAGQHEQGYMVFGIGAQLFPGRFRCRYEVEVLDCAADEIAATLDVATDDGVSVLGSRRVKGGIGHEVVELEFKVDRFTRVEPRVFYEGCGNVAVNRIKMEEVKD